MFKRAVTLWGSMLSMIAGCVASEPQTELMTRRQALPEAERLCSGVVGAQSLGIEPTQPPAVVTVPSNACIADDTASLVAQMNLGCVDIVLRPGTYTPGALPNGSYLSFGATHRLWAEVPGSVTLEFGIYLGNRHGSELHGLHVHITDPAFAVPLGRQAAVSWAQARDVRIEDTYIRGSNVVEFGVRGLVAQGARLRRVVVQDFLRFGVRIDHTSGPTVQPRADLRDIVVLGVGDPAWRASANYLPGTEEHGIWLGASATLDRAQVRDVWWAGIIVGDVSDGVDGVGISNADVARVGVGDGLRGAGKGIAFERISSNSFVRQFCSGPDVERGLHIEWDADPARWAQNIEFVSGWIIADVVGVYLGQGATNTRVSDVTVEDACWAGLALQCATAQVTCQTTQTSNFTTTLPPQAAACTVDLTGSSYPTVCPTTQVPSIPCP